MNEINYDKKLCEVYRGMKDRANGRKENDRHRYIGRGITVDYKSWPTIVEFKRDMKDSYIKHVEEHGVNNTQIDRIDNDKGYSPDNCKWSTRSENSRNRHNTFWVEWEGERLPATVLSEKLFGKNRRTYLYNRLKAGWTIEEAIRGYKVQETKVKRSHAHMIEYNGEMVRTRDLSQKLFNHPGLIWRRIYSMGWSEERAINAPRIIKGIRKKQIKGFKAKTVMYNGEEIGIDVLSRKLFGSRGVIRRRIKQYGYTLEDAINKPVKRRRVPSS
jgi:hypothetical protein